MGPVQLLLAILIGIMLIALSVWFWGVLVGYVQPGADAELRKEVVQTFALIVAGVVGAVGGIVGIGNLQTSRRNLQEQREREHQRLQEDALQSYFKELRDLLTENNLKNEKPEGYIASLARAQTLTVLQGLDKDRKRILLLFLYEADLIIRDQRVIDLSDADFSEANLSGADLSGADLRKANLYKADLSGVADLRGALLGGANLRLAKLGYAKLQNADLSGPRGWEDIDLRNKESEWGLGANLSGADLYRAFLMGANLTNASLSVANLEEASFDDADLSGAFLLDAKGITNEELHEKSKSLRGAKMPTGQLYENWLKDLRLPPPSS